MENKGITLKHLINRDNSAMTRASCQRRLEEIFTAHDKVPIARILSIMLRKRGEVQNDPFFWSDKTFQKKLEQYQKEFSANYNPDSGEFDLNEDYYEG